MLRSWYKALFKIGEMSGCHQMPERSFFIKEKQFPVCARCTGAVIGYCAGGITYLFFKLPIIICVSFCVIMFVDWLLQRLQIAESTNLRRLITGTVCGFGLIQLYLAAFVFLVNKIYLLFI